MSDKEKKPKESHRKRIVVVLLSASLMAALLCTLLYKLSLLLSISTNKQMCGFTECLDRILEGPPKPDNPYIKKFLRSKYFDPPSTAARNLSGINDGIVDKNYDMIKSVLRDALKKGNHSFVVLGAGDGEYKDLTLDLETEMGWTGLLVEPIPFLYQKLKEKNRNVETANLCISPSEFSWRTTMTHPEVKDHLSDKEKINLYRQAALTIVQPNSKEFFGSTIVQCVPLETILTISDVIGDEVKLLVLNMGARNGDVLAAISTALLPKLMYVVTVTLSYPSKHMNVDSMPFAVEFVALTYVVTVTHADVADDTLDTVLSELSMVALKTGSDLLTGPEHRKLYIKLRERIDDN